MLTTAAGVYRTPTVVLQDAAHVLPFGQGTFPLGGGMYAQTAKSAVATSPSFNTYAAVYETRAITTKILPFGLGTFPPGGGLANQSNSIVGGAIKQFEPYGLILENYGRPPQQTFLSTPVTSPIGTSFRDGSIRGWRGLPDVWIMERSPDWGVLESFTPPPPPQDPPQKGLWDLQSRLVAFRKTRYILRPEPYYQEPSADLVPIGNTLNATQTNLIPIRRPIPELPYYRGPLFAGVLGPPKKDAPPVGGYAQRVIQWAQAREYPSRVVQTLRQLTPPGAFVRPTGDLFNLQLKSFLAENMDTLYPAAKVVREPNKKIQPFGAGTFPLGGGSAGDTATFPLSVWDLYKPYSLILESRAQMPRRPPIGFGAFVPVVGTHSQAIQGLIRSWPKNEPYTPRDRDPKILPFGQGTFPLGGGTTDQTANLIVQAWPQFSPYSLILEPFGRPKRQTFLQTTIDSPNFDSFRDRTLQGWRGESVVWIMERSPDWAVLEPFTPPPSPQDPPLKGLWDLAQRLQAFRTTRFVLRHDPYYDEPSADAPPLGNIIIAQATTWPGYVRPTIIIPDRNLIAALLAPPRTDNPPIGGWSQRWVQWQLARENPSLILQRPPNFSPLPDAPPFDWFRRQLTTYQAAEIKEAYSIILESIAEFQKIPLLPGTPPPLGNPWALLEILYWLTKSPEPELPWYWLTPLPGILAPPPPGITNVYDLYHYYQSHS